jgi:hypothetical protein
MFGRTSILRFHRDASKASKNAGRSETINDDHEAEIPDAIVRLFLRIGGRVSDGYLWSPRRVTVRTSDQVVRN